MTLLKCAIDPVSRTLHGLFCTVWKSGKVPAEWKEGIVLSECMDVKNYKLRLNLVWHRMLYSSTHMATVGVKGLTVSLSYAIS